MSRPAPCDAASERDSRFFENHPRRTCRIRPAVDGELPGLTTPAEGWAMIVVKQIQPGVRARVAFTSPSIIPDSEKAALGVLGRMFGDGR